MENELQFERSFQTQQSNLVKEIKGKYEQSIDKLREVETKMNLNVNESVNKVELNERNLDQMKN